MREEKKYLKQQKSNLQRFLFDVRFLFLFPNVNHEGIMTYTAADHQRVIERVWLH